MATLASHLTAILWLASSAQAVPMADVFPGGTSTTLEATCESGFSVGGGTTVADQVSSYQALGECRIYCGCTAPDGSCKYCCKVESGGGCSRHAPLYKYTKAGSDACFTCPVRDDGTLTGLLQAHVDGVVGTSAEDSSFQWLARGDQWWRWTYVSGSQGLNFQNNDDVNPDEVVCFALVPSSGAASGRHAQDATCGSFPATETSTTASVPVGSTESTYVSPYLSPILNQGGCGNCFVQSAVAQLTDRVLRVLPDAERDRYMKDKLTFSTGTATRCHPDSCDGGQPHHIMSQFTGQSPKSDILAFPYGASFCSGGVTGGPGTKTDLTQNDFGFWSEWAYGCNKGCQPFRAGFAGPIIPSGSSCPADYTDDQATLAKVFVPEGTPIDSSNLSHFGSSEKCGCEVKLEATGSCTSCCAFRDGRLSNFDDYPEGKCNWEGMDEWYWVKPKDQYTSFANTSEGILKLPVPLHSKLYALKECGCPAAKVVLGSNPKCSKCCFPGSPPDGGQYTAQPRAVQEPPTCSGEGVTAGSTPGADACTVGKCTGSCDNQDSTYPDPPIFFDDSANTVYSPVGVGHGGAWNDMNEYFIKDEIKQHGPVVSSFGVPQSWHTFFDEPSNAEKVYSIPPEETIKITGYHATVIVGWGESDGKKYWLVRNSWGRDWADSGYFRVEIGGRVSGPEMSFATGNQGVGAMVPLFKSGSSRRLVTPDIENMTKTAKRAVDISLDTNGGHMACRDDHHGEQIKAMRDAFLANESNYGGIDPSCSIPWEGASVTDCTVQVVRGLHAKMMIHAKSCKGSKYAWRARFVWADLVDVKKVQVVHSAGPHLLDDAPVTSSESDDKKDVPQTSAASGLSGWSLIFLMTLRLCFHFGL